MVAHRRKIELTRDESAAALAGARSGRRHLGSWDGPTRAALRVGGDSASGSPGLPRGYSVRQTPGPVLIMAAPPMPGRPPLRDAGYHAMPAKPGERCQPLRGRAVVALARWAGLVRPHAAGSCTSGGGGPTRGCIAHGAVVGADVDPTARMSPRRVAARGPRRWPGAGKRLAPPLPRGQGKGSGPPAGITGRLLARDGRRSWPPGRPTLAAPSRSCRRQSTPTPATLPLADPTRADRPRDSPNCRPVPASTPSSASWG
jgi:hypothetical protein